MKAPARIALPTASPNSPEMRQLAHKWEGFVAGKDIDLSDVPLIMREAWLRAKQAGIDPAITHATPSVSSEVSPPPLQLLKDTEAELIVHALKQTESVSRAASLLGLHHSTLYRKLKKYRIKLPRN